MGTQVTAGPGNPETWWPCQGHPNDPRTDPEAFNQKVEKTAESLRAGACRDELADYLCRYTCDIEMIGLLDAFTRGDKEKLFERFGDIVESSVYGLAELMVEEEEQ